MTPEKELFERIAIEQQIDAALGRVRTYTDHPPKPAPAPKKPEQPNLITRPDSLAELFRVAASLPRAEVVAYLQRNRHPALIMIGRYVLDPAIQFGVVPPQDYRPSLLPQESLSLYQEARRLYTFATDPQRPSPIRNDPGKMQELFEDMLRGLLADEAALLIEIVRKQLPIDHTILLDAFDELKHCDELAMDRRANATTYAQDNLRNVMTETTKSIKQLDLHIRELDAERQRLVQQREHEYHRQLAAKRMVGNVM
jgi:hypothetical protein